MQAGGHHAGILIVRYDNHAARDLTPRGIGRAVGKMESAGIALADEFQILNPWR
jgi:hypothetical protein